MVICFDGHCYEVVIIDWWPPFRPGPGPINYPALISDATLVASVNAAGVHAYDEGVRAALQSGIDEAVKAMQKRAADGIEIRHKAA
jgi:hypothetical protein